VYLKYASKQSVRLMEVGFIFIDGGELPNARNTAGCKMTSREVREADSNF
jgi:hypothetical protein